MGVAFPHLPAPRLPGVPRLPARPHVPPLWLESRAALEATALRRSPVWRGVDVAPGDGRPVLLVPGFLAGDGTLATMTQWLQALGYTRGAPASAPT